MEFTQKNKLLQDRVLRVLDGTHGVESGEKVLTMPPKLSLLKLTDQTSIEAVLYEPAVCLILQGEKEVTLGNRNLRVGAGHSLIVSHDLPVMSRVTQASAEKPYLAIVVDLDLAILRGLYDQLDHINLNQEKNHSLDFAHTNPNLLDALDRYLALIDSPTETKVMAPLILEEIHFRLLLASQGGMLRQLIWHDSHASRISRAMQQIRQNFRGQIMIPELAKGVGMSSSSFHQHFKSITATTPLQYLKDLRLLEARRLLQLGSDSVSNIAFEVGYESPTQFSREYARKFGASPRHDLAVAAA